MFLRALKSRRHRGRIVALGLVGLAALVGISGCAAVTVVPAVGAQAAEVLRGIIGDQAVAQLETFVFQVEDDVHQIAYQLGVANPSAPWAGTPVASVPTDLATPTDVSASDATETPPAQTPAASPTPALGPTATPQAATPEAVTPTAPATQAVWLPAALKPLGSLPGEGQWQAYLQNSSGHTVAYRTFLQPDRQRPYAVVAIVAFDLTATRLHFVLGTLEPVSTVAIPRPGTIPAGDLQASKLLATFNGGFKARHGHFGLMVNGITLIPPRDALGTVAFYGDGHVTIGQWGTDITPSSDVVTWRQNGPLVVQNGQINPHTADDAPQDWGFTVKGVTAVWRSGIGMSADGRTLYYIAGPSLTLPALANAMVGAGMTQAIQLDINNFWVHFDAIQGPQMQASPLLDKMNNNVGRYLTAYPRDFFYMTADGG